VVALRFRLFFSSLPALALGRAIVIPRQRLLAEDRDDSMAGGLLVAALQSNPPADYFEMEPVARRVARFLRHD